MPPIRCKRTLTIDLDELELLLAERRRLLDALTEVQTENSALVEERRDMGAEVDKLLRAIDREVIDPPSGVQDAMAPLGARRRAVLGGA